MEFIISGSVKFDLGFTISAENEESAKKLAEERVRYLYCLDSIGVHYKQTVELKLIVEESQPKF